MLTRTQASRPRPGSRWTFKAKARIKDSSLVLKDNQGPRTKGKDNILGLNQIKLAFIPSWRLCSYLIRYFLIN